MTPREAYSTDFHQWTKQTARLIREHRWRDLDVEHLANEIEDLGKSERRGVSSQLTRLLVHLLKWHYQPGRRSDSWRDSIADSRLQIELALDESPSLKSYPDQQLAGCYRKARRSAAIQTSLPLEQFPEDCPFALEDILEEEWLPDYTSRGQV